MATSSVPPVEDPDKVPNPAFEEPDYNEPVEDPDSGELPEDEPEEDEDEDEIPDDEPLRA